MRPIVYVVQIPLIRHRETGELQPRFNIEPAKQYGELKVVLPHPFRFSKDPCEPLIVYMRDTLKHFSDNDSLLAIGDPISISVASAIAASRNGGRVKLLKWNNVSHEYEQIQITTH